MVVTAAIAVAGGPSPARGAAPRSVGATAARPRPKSAQPARARVAPGATTTMAPPAAVTAAEEWVTRPRPWGVTSRSPNRRPAASARAKAVKAIAARPAG